MINQPNSKIVARYNAWARNRAVIEGEDAVKAAGKTYLPKNSTQQTDDEYKLWIENVAFYPAASRTVELLLGLIFRKRPVLTASPAVDALANAAVTRDGLSIEQFANKVTRETLITNYTGVLVDHPKRSNFPSLNKANMVQLGFRPYLCMYVAENIIDVCRAEVGGLSKLVKVVLRDECGDLRELVLENGVYVQRIHKQDGANVVLVEETIPEANGKPMTEIPFVIVSTEHEIDPQPALMDQAVGLNLHHYKVEGKLSLAHLFLSSPVPWVTGAIVDKENPLFVAPGSLWSFDKPETKVGYLEFTGAGVQSIERQRDKLEHHLATVGARILASQPNVAESADTHRIKRASESSALATSARTISSKIKQALVWFADWYEGSGEQVDFLLNTDFLPGTMTAQELDSMVKLYQGGLLSHQTAFFRMRDGEFIEPSLTYEEETKRLSSGPQPPAPVANSTPPIAE